MIKLKIINFLRKILFLPFHIIQYLESFYTKILQQLDPNGSECYKEELYQKKIDSKIGSNLKIKKNYFKSDHEYKSKIYDYDNPIKFYTPTKISSFRAASLFIKEPYTLEWIENNGGKDIVFLDIGANIGTYSLYYASVFNGQTFSFEPAYRNLDLLVKNINLNKFNDFITVIPNPIYKKVSNKHFTQSKNIAGLAEATYGKEFLGNILKKKTKLIYNFKTLSLTIDKIFKLIDQPSQSLIKIDVDGNEIEILMGAKEFINGKDCKSIMIETREETRQDVKIILEEAGFENKTTNLPSNTATANEYWHKNSLE